MLVLEGLMMINFTKISSRVAAFIHFGGMADMSASERGKRFGGISRPGPVFLEDFADCWKE